MDKTYIIGVECTNCQHVPQGWYGENICCDPVYIPKGTSVMDFLQDKKCGKCGCKTLIKYRNK